MKDEKGENIGTNKPVKKKGCINFIKHIQKNTQ